MDINPESIERLAREYGRAYSSAQNSPDNSGILEQLTLLEEEQLDLLNDIPARNSVRVNRTVGYLKNLVYRSLSAIGTLSGNTSYIPSVRSQNPSCQTQSALNRIMNLQLDIFILLDKLTFPFPERAELLNLENRKAALMAGI